MNKKRFTIPMRRKMIIDPLDGQGFALIADEKGITKYSFTSVNQSQLFEEMGSLEQYRGEEEEEEE